MSAPRLTPVPELNLHRQGRGRPLICLHGVGHHWQAFSPVLGRLAAGGFEVIAADLPGFGGSPPLPGDDLSIPAYVGAIAAWIEAQGLEAAVVGNSMGGAIALELVRRGVAGQAVAISPAGFWSPRELRFCQLSLRLTKRIPQAARPLVLRTLGTRAGRRLLLAQYFSRADRVPGEEAQATILNLWRSPAFAGAVEAFSSYRFPDTRHPAAATGHPREGVDAHGAATGRARGAATGPARGAAAGPAITVAWGSRDRLLPYALQAPRARRELPQARHVTLPGLGHVPFWDDPGMVARVVLGVLG